MPKPAYEWPTRSTYTFSLPERPERGQLSTRAYVAVMMVASRPGQVGLGFHERAIAAAGDAFQRLRQGPAGQLHSDEYWSGRAIWFNSIQQWQTVREEVCRLLAAMYEGR